MVLVFARVEARGSRRGSYVISRGQSAVWPPDLAAGVLEPLEGLLRRVSAIPGPGPGYQASIPVKSLHGQDAGLRQVSTSASKQGQAQGRCAMLGGARARTNIQQEGAVGLLIDNMGLEDLVVEGPWRSLGSGHCATVRWGRRVMCGVVCAWQSWPGYVRWRRQAVRGGGLEAGPLVCRDGQSVGGDDVGWTLDGMVLAVRVARLRRKGQGRRK